MKVAIFSSKPYDEQYLTSANRDRHELIFHNVPLSIHTAALAEQCEVVCCFVNDRLDSAVLHKLFTLGVTFIALRCAGFNQVDLATAKTLGIVVARVPEYSPHAVAEHALALILVLNRNLHRAYNRVRENDYSLNGLIGFDVVKKTVGVIGTGKIGEVFAHIMKGIGCNVIAYDPAPSATLIAEGIPYVSLKDIWSQADIISLHCPLTTATQHLINADVIDQMKNKVMLINTGRGGLIDTRAAVTGLKSGKIGHLGLDVYEEESELFFEDYSNQVLQDDVFARLLTFPNVVITGHQAFFTHEALTAISEITLGNIDNFSHGDLDKVFTIDSN